MALYQQQKTLNKIIKSSKPTFKLFFKSRFRRQIAFDKMEGYEEMLKILREVQVFRRDVRLIAGDIKILIINPNLYKKLLLFKQSATNACIPTIKDLLFGFTYSFPFNDLNPVDFCYPHPIEHDIELVARPGRIKTFIEPGISTLPTGERPFGEMEKITGKEISFKTIAMKDMGEMQPDIIKKIKF